MPFEKETFHVLVRLADEEHPTSFDDLELLVQLREEGGDRLLCVDGDDDGELRLEFQPELQNPTEVLQHLDEVSDLRPDLVGGRVVDWTLAISVKKAPTSPRR